MASSSESSLMEEKEESSACATTDMEQDDDDDVCPICLCVPDCATVGPCGHQLCVPCMERILLAKRSPLAQNIHNQSDPDAYLSAPTLGRCPICRSELSLFDLEQSDGTLLIEKDYDIHTSPIAGLTYAREGQIGCFSYHFPNANQMNNECDSHGRPLPFMSFESAADDVALDNGSPPPPRKYFEEGCHFHSKSRTFHGKLVWSNNENEVVTWKGAMVWEVVMQFSSDLRYVSGGTMVKRRDAPIGKLHPWPLDGRWKVTWEQNPEDFTFIDVLGGEFRLYSFEYSLDTSNPKSPRFTWPMTPHSDDTATLQTAVSGVDLEAQPEGPPVGATVVWTTTDPEYTRIVWERQSISTSPPHRVEVFGPGRGFLYQRVETGATRSTSLPSYHANTLWGNTFIQGLKVGLASYHFSSSSESAYISYEHPLCAQWPSLDDGSPVPSRVSFRDIEWDAVERVLRGNIKWQDEYGTTWQGAKKWMYEIRFDSEYTCIVSGKVNSVFHDDEIQDMSTFGDSLIYINAGITEKFDRELDNAAAGEGETQSQASSPGYDRWRSVSRDLRRRLESEGVSVRTMATIQRVLVLTQQPGADVIDFNT